MKIVVKISALIIALHILQIPIQAMDSRLTTSSGSESNQALELLKNVQKLPNELKLQLCSFIDGRPLGVRGNEQKKWTYIYGIAKNDTASQSNGWRYNAKRDLVFDDNRESKEYIFYPSKQKVVSTAGPNERGLIAVEDKAGTHLSVLKDEKEHIASKFWFNRHRTKLRNGEIYLHPNAPYVVSAIKATGQAHYASITVLKLQGKRILAARSPYNEKFNSPEKLTKLCFGPATSLWITDVTTPGRLALSQYDYERKKWTKEIDFSETGIQECTDLSYSDQQKDLVLIAGFCGSQREQKTIFAFNAKDYTLDPIGSVPATQEVVWNDPMILRMAKKPVGISNAIASVWAKPVLSNLDHAYNHAIQLMQSHLLTKAAQHWLNSSAKSAEEGKEIIGLLKDESVICNAPHLIRNTGELFKDVYIAVYPQKTAIQENR